MGLDMYLSAEKYLSKYKEEDKAVLDKINAALPKIGYFPFDGCLKTEVAYWRKANAVHGWFVRNVQDGKDDCEQYPVSREQLAELVQICKDVIAGKNTNELDPVAGFFFGGTEKDGYYLDDLQSTIEQLEPLLDPQYEDWYFHYQSSW